MAKPNIQLLHAIRRTAEKLELNAPYQWGHMGSCNCGHLAQEITGVSKADIHRFAMYSEGSWTDQSRAYLAAHTPAVSRQRADIICATSGLPMDLLISSMIDFGLEIEDLEHLEKLSDAKVLKYLGVRKLRYNQRKDVVLYMRGWADLLEAELLSKKAMTDLKQILKPARQHEPVST